MLVTPLPGVDRARLLDTLRRLLDDVTNARGASHTTVGRYLAYIRWVTEAARVLAGQVSSADLDRLVLTRRYWALQALLTSVVDPIGHLVDIELDERSAALKEACRSLAEQIDWWSRPGRFVVADTSVYCRAAKLEELDLGEILGLRDEPVHLLLPMVVVDELDGLKQSSDRSVRWRAGYTLAVLDRVMTGSASSGRLRDADFAPLASGGIPRGEITVEIVGDPPGHTRLPINDDEIIDRAVAIQILANRPLTIVTYDTGQSHRARVVGLRVAKLTEEIGEEPSPQRATPRGPRQVGPSGTRAGVS